MAGLADTKGHLTRTYQYTVTGELTHGSATYENEYTYNGESYNPNIHSQYLRARYYSVVTASFLTEDSYLGNIREPLTLNRYNYCVSSYLNYVDPSGNMGVRVLNQLYNEYSAGLISDEMLTKMVIGLNGFDIDTAMHELAQIHAATSIGGMIYLEQKVKEIAELAFIEKCLIGNKEIDIAQYTARGIYVWEVASIGQSLRKKQKQIDAYIKATAPLTQAGYRINAVEDIHIIKDYYMMVYSDLLSAKGEIIRYSFYKKTKEGDKKEVKLKEVKAEIQLAIYQGEYKDIGYVIPTIFGDIKICPSDPSRLFEHHSIPVWWPIPIPLPISLL